MPIVIKKVKNGALDEFVMVEIQGDLENRHDEVKDCSGAFVGDVLYNKFGHPVNIFILKGTQILFSIAIFRFSSSVTTSYSDKSKVSRSRSR